MIGGDGKTTKMTNLDGRDVLATIVLTAGAAIQIANGLEKVLSSVAAKQSYVQAYLAQASELNPQIYNQAQEVAEQVVGSGDMVTAAGSFMLATLCALGLYHIHRPK